MHTKITTLELLIWLAAITGQSIVLFRARQSHYKALTTYLAVELGSSLILFAVAHLMPWQAYYTVWSINNFVNYATQAYLAASIFLTIRSTGIPSKSHPTILQVFAGALFAVAILTLRVPLASVLRPEWRTFLAVDHTVSYWLCLVLAVAPVYSWLVDSAKDTRLTLTYLGLAVYVAVHSGAVDYALASHAFTRARHIPEFAYLASLSLWFCSCNYLPATHQWDPAQTESLKVALREKRSHLNELATHERSPNL